MKKVLSIFLVLALAVGVSTAAYAVSTGAVTVTITTTTAGKVNLSDATQASGTEDHFDIPITGTLDGSFNENEVEANFYVYLSWSVNSDLTYTIRNTDYAWTVYDSGGNTSTKDSFAGPVSAGYVGSGDWTGSAEISARLENWSNRALTVAFSYADKTAEAEGILQSIDTGAVRSFEADAGTVWSADTTPADGGLMSLASAAADVLYGADPSADNVARGAVTMRIDAEQKGPDGKSLMAGDIVQDGISIGALTLRITAVSA